MNESNYPVLEGWETVRVIGSGSSGNVYEIRKSDEYGGNLHSALKVISVPETHEEYEEMAASMSEDELRSKLHSKAEEITNEYRLMGVLKGHRNIVSCEDQMVIGHKDDLGFDIYIRMELLTSLPDYVHKHGMTITDVTKLCTDICSALEACKQSGIIHRDIKPQNIFVSKYGDYKLGDFGVAKATFRGSFEKVGTYSYMAPEVYKGRQYDSSVDIYSLGMVLYWLLNERRGPFLPLPPVTPTDDDIAGAQLRRMRGERLPAPKFGKEPLKQLVLKACSFFPEDRFANPTEMKNAALDAAKGKGWNGNGVSQDDPTVREAVPTPKPVVKEPSRLEPTKPRQPVQPIPNHEPVKPEPKPTPKPKAKPVEEDDEDEGGSGYTVLLILLILIMLAGIVLFIMTDGTFFGILDGKDTPTPVATTEPTPTPEPTANLISLILSSPSITVKEGETAILTVSSIPELDLDKDVKLVWKSSDSGIVTVDSEGNVGGVKAGTATVRVYAENKLEVYDECTVTVEKPVITSLVIEQEPTKTRYSIGEELDTTGLILRASYDNNSERRIDDPTQYTVTGDLNGLGSRTITVTYDGATVTFTVWVGLF